MNTTKNECDGWIDAYKTKPPRGKSVLIHSCMGNSCVGWWENEYWQGPVGSIPVAMVRHWRELPEPPKPKDAFEIWWGGHAKTDYDALVITNGDEHFCAKKEIARYIWEAAINSTKQ